MKKSDGKYTSKEKVELHELVMPLLKAMQEEFKELCKKKPEAVLSKSKVKIVNRLLESCRKVLDSEQSLQFLDLLDEDNVPQNSDVVLALSQYVASMDQFESKYYVWDEMESDNRWLVKK